MSTPASPARQRLVSGSRWLGPLLLAVVIGGFLGGYLRPQSAARSPVVAAEARADWLRAIYHPLHFAPASRQARDEQCLTCHGEVLSDQVQARSPAGLAATESRAWYQTLSTYQGPQESFHRRHLLTPLARELMALRCATCHLGHEPRDEAPATSATATAATSGTLRKQVDVERICLQCHGQLATEIMGLPGPWPVVKGLFGESCLTCHATIRTVRHQVDYLQAAAIERAGARDTNVCYGCHGGRAWYRLAYPYPRHAWPGSGEQIPEWAKNRPPAPVPHSRPLATVDHPAGQKP